MSNTIAFVQSRDSVVFNLDGDLKTIPRTHLNYDRIITALETGDLEAVRPLLIAVKQFIADSSDGSITFNGSQLLFEGEPLHLSMVTRIVGLIRDGYDVRPLTNFLRNLLDNPSPRAREELYSFLEVNNLPVTADGCFIAYKMVSATFRDLYTGTMDNSPGATPSMKRQDVDADKHRTCSKGLHFAALEYVVNGGYGSRDRGNRLVAVKVNPRDVVAIPTDYNNSKGRACQYLILKELDWDTRLPLNTTGFKFFAGDADQSADSDTEAAVAASGGDVFTLTSGGAKQSKVGAQLYSDADIRRVKKLLTDKDETLTSIERKTGMSRRQVARIRDGEVGAHIAI